MRLNPPEAVALANIYRIWVRSSRTAAWVRLGAVLATMVERMGGWSQVHQFVVEHLATIPAQHFKLAYADHLLRTHGNPFAN